jgi:anti-sigma regulatory factor (Ser/Thr protein kinase)
MEVRDLGPEPASRRVFVEDASGVGEVRRTAHALAGQLGFDEVRGSQTALVATEMATNILKHAERGEILLRAVRQPERPAVELVALDRGPGLGSLSESLTDGFSTQASPGTGLGAIRRAADVFEVQSQPGQGTVVLARVESGPHPPPSAWDLGAVCLPKTGERVPGDAWTIVEGRGTLRVMVADGLGHGAEAAKAAEAAIRVFRGHPDMPLMEVMEHCHHALRPTRGAAVAAAEIDAGRAEVRFVGVGNITAAVFSGEASRSLVSLNGTVGQQQIRLREFTYAWTADGLAVLASDGLKSRWSLSAYPGLSARHPALLAAVLYRDHGRGNDDVTVVALRRRTRSA